MASSLPTNIDTRGKSLVLYTLFTGAKAHRTVERVLIPHSSLLTPPPFEVGQSEYVAGALTTLVL